jgi:large-conductance mechanosensitive channel
LWKILTPKRENENGISISHSGGRPHNSKIGGGRKQLRSTVSHRIDFGNFVFVIGKVNFVVIRKVFYELKKRLQELKQKNGRKQKKTFGKITKQRETNWKNDFKLK